MLVYKGCHGEVDGSHHLIAHFHNRNFSSLCVQVLCHFQPDKSGLDDNSLSGSMTVDIFFDSVCVGYIPECEDSVQVDSRQGPGTTTRSGPASARRTASRRNPREAVAIGDGTRSIVEFLLEILHVLRRVLHMRSSSDVDVVGGKKLRLNALKRPPL